jgi:hypothetical protein
MIEQYNTWYPYIPEIKEGDVIDLGTGIVQYMVAGPDPRADQDGGYVKVRWRNDIVDPGEFITYYGYRRPIPERYFATPEQVEEWVLSAVHEFCSEYEYYPLWYGLYTEERSREPLEMTSEVAENEKVKGKRQVTPSDVLDSSGK